MAEANPVFDPMGALQQMTDLPRMMLDQQKVANERNVAQLGRTREAADYAASPEMEDAQRMGALATAAAATPLEAGGMGALLANIGGAYGSTLAKQAQQRFEREKEMAGLTEKASPFGGQGVATQLAHSLLNPIQNVGGVGVNRLTGQAVVPKQFTDKAMDLQKMFYQKLVEAGEPDAYQQSQRMAQTWLENAMRNPSVAGSTYGQRPEATPMPAQADIGAPRVQPTGKTGDVVAGSWSPEQVAPGTTLTDDQKADAIASQLASIQSEKKRYGDNPLVLADLNKKEADLRKQIGALGTGVTSPAQAKIAASPNFSQPVGKVELGRQETTAKETAKDLVDYEKQLTASNDTANTMLRNIGHLAEEAKSANFGAGAGAKTQALKWADTLGVTLDPKDRDAMNANQVIGKIALQLATIGAKNISSRPTQMEFQKLLEEGVPATGMTKESFNKVLNLFKETAQAEQGQLSEFMKFKHSMPAGTVSAGDFSDYWALRKDPRYYNLNINDVLDTMKERKMSFNQVISKLRERK